jgi:uncharacterized protein YcbX
MQLNFCALILRILQATVHEDVRRRIRDSIKPEHFKSNLVLIETKKSWTEKSVQEAQEGLVWSALVNEEHFGLKVKVSFKYDMVMGF